MFKAAILALAASLLPCASLAQVVTHSTALADTDGDGIITIVNAKTVPPVKRGTMLVICPAAPAHTYAVNGTPCPGIVAAPPAPTSAPLFGANLSGAEASGGDAVRPSLDDLKNYIDRFGFKLIRYPFKMERMTDARIAELKVLVDYARSKRVPFILDNHNFGWPLVAEQVAAWTAFAKHWPADGSVLLELNNEPKGVSYTQFGIDAKAVIAGLRANGVKHPLLLGGPGYSAISRFDKGESRTKVCESAACGLDRAPGPLDPLNLTYIVGHKYFDWNSSGTSASCKRSDGTIPTSSNFDTFAAQVRKRGWKAYITEAAFGSYKGIPSTCAAVGADAIADMKANADVLRGVTWWGGGRIWPESYIYKMDPKKADRFTAPVPHYVQSVAHALETGIR